MNIVVATKRCMKCLQRKPHSEFSKNPKLTLGLRTYCKACDSAAGLKYYYANQAEQQARNRRWRKANPERVKEHNKLNSLKKYNLTPDEKQAMLAAQGDVCAICSGDNSGSKLGWHVDHCHKTKIVRGILCTGCNIMLGRAKDRPHVLRVAANYLERFAQ
jgi:Recombination endonuclease VII